MFHMIHALFPLAATIILGLPSEEAADDTPAIAKHEWPQWRGPNRDAVSTETGLLRTWSKSGPPELRRVEILEGKN